MWPLMRMIIRTVWLVLRGRVLFIMNGKAWLEFLSSDKVRLSCLFTLDIIINDLQVYRHIHASMNRSYLQFYIF